MNQPLLSCFAGLLAAATAYSQAPAAPQPPGAALRPKMPENQILEYGSFELPRVKERLPKLKGGNILMFYSDEWMTFQGDPERAAGTLTVGLTNEIARTGRQSIFVEFNKLKKPRAEAILSSQLIAVKPSQPYRVGIWGRMDKKQPLTLDQPLPSLRLQVDFFEGDGETQTGDQVFRVQPMPGSRDRPPFFVTKTWREYYADLTIPEEAGFIKITWSWLAPPEPGEINGVMYFDDATLIGEKVEPPEEPVDPEAKPAAVDGAPAPPATGDASAPAQPPAPPSVPAPAAVVPAPAAPAAATPAAKKPTTPRKK